RHKPALPLFTLEEARQCLTLFQARDYHAPFEVVPEVTATFFDAGHILGSAWVELQAAGRRVVFSGDLGRRDAPILRDPEPLTRADYLVCEATYGDRLHSGKPVRDELRRILQRTVSRRGVLVIPAFAVERTQEVVYILDELAEARDIPRIPVFIDSPMAVEATRLFHRYTDYYDEEARRLLETGRRVLDYPYLKLCSTVPESRAIHEQKPPFVVLAASGMATGGRILHHLKRYLPDRDNTVLLVGYQSVGTRGWSLAQGLPRIKIFGEWVPVQAQVENLDGFSGHADYAQIMGWLGGLEQAPRRTWLVHGELPALEAMRLRLGGELGWDVVVPAHLHEEDVE
ncbi:MAG TPA: MBL fold metallo-hydrolase, partial [Candidatus Nitrosotenuis sp.]|nr:MBL fold metallo-hydrolase [Candidatus Nitrosotenuis sp.]